MNIDGQQVIWSQKYRPQTIEDCIFTDDQRSFFQNMIDSKQVMNCLLAGAPGCGKTTVAKILVNQLGCEYLFLNGSGEDRGIATVKTKIQQFVSTNSLFGEEGTQKVVIYDEADHLTNDSQAALRSLIEENSKNCVFILTANYPGKIIDPLKSRCKPIIMDPPRENRKDLAVQMIKRCAAMLKNENVEFDVESLKRIVIAKYPDYRSIIGDLQYFTTKYGSINAIAADMAQQTSVNELIRLLSEKNFKDMVGWVYENVQDTMQVYNHMATKVFDIFEPDSVPMAVILLDEYMSKYATVPDKHLSLIACLTKLMAETNVR